MLSPTKLIGVIALALSVFVAAPAAAQMMLYRGNGAEPDSLDPNKSQGHWEANIIGDMIMGLMTEDPAAKPIPGSAKAWTTSEDGLTWTFTIDERAKWSDGVPVTADDFVFAWRRLLDPNTKSQYASILYVVKNARQVNGEGAALETLGVRAIDPMTFEVKLEHPAPYLLELVTHQASFPVPKHLVEKVGDAWVKPGTMISNGPYVLATWIPNDHIKLVKNPTFYDTQSVKIDEVYFYPTQDTQAALKRFRAGELDMQDGFPSTQIDWLRQNMPDSVRLFPYLGLSYLIFNNERPAFKDKRVREALSLALNREVISGTIYKLGEKPAYTFVPPGTANYPGTAYVKFRDMPVEERVARAQQLLAEAGYGPDNKLRLSFTYAYDADGKRAAVAIADMWKKIGCIVEENQQESRTIYSNIFQKQNFDVGMAAWIADFNDAENFLFMLESNNAGFNYGHWFNTEYDALMQRAYASKDLTERGNLMAQAEQILLDEVGIAPVRYRNTQYLVAPHVKGFTPNMREIFRSRWLYIEGRSVPVAGGTTNGAGDETNAQVETEQSWSDWFASIMCSWFGIWCTGS
jgi:oligopeptide transport system substrate-binding protein